MTTNRKISWTRRLTLALMAATCMTAPSALYAQVDPANGSTQVYDAPNGVPVVDIANPNGAGLSHNKFNDYNVDNRGLVLNNGDISELSRKSQLAGQVPANLNLSGEASVILNEVVTTKRSTLAGYTEVVGGAADVIVANPNGITCNGCGFINTPNVSLTTGVPELSGGALTGFRTETGDILITGTGLDGTNQDYMALIGRSVTLEGQANSKGTLDVVAGANDWDYNARSATGIAPTGTAPTVAIDSSALGGMYANRIRLIATEAGVGVKMNGEAAAGTGDFVLDSSGKIEINGKISSEKDIRITSSAAGAKAFHATNASISAKNNTTIKAASGEARLDGGTVTAAKALTIESSTLVDEATGAAGADNNKRYGGDTLNLTQTGTTTINGTSHGAGNTLNINTASLTAGSSSATNLYSDGSATIEASTGINLGNLALKTKNDLTVSALVNDINVGANTKIQSTQGDIALNGTTAIVNSGTISADTGKATLRTNGILHNIGAINAGSIIDIAQKTGGGTLTVTNSGQMLAADHFTMNANTLNNNGTAVIQGNTGDSALNVAGKITNAAGAKIIVTKNAAGNGTVNFTDMDNSGLLQSGGTLQINSNAGTLANLAGSKIISAGNITMRGQNAGTYNVNNTGLIQSTGGTVDIKGNGGGRNVNYMGLANGVLLGTGINIMSLLTQVNNNSKINATANALTIDTTNLTMSGQNSVIVAGTSATTGTSTVTVGSGLDNYGMIFSGGNLNLTTNGTLINRTNAGLASNATLKIDAKTNAFSNYGDIYGGTLLDIKAASFNNYNKVDAGSMTVKATTFINEYEINVANNLTVDAVNFYNRVVGGDQRVWNTGATTSSGGSWGSDPNWFVWGDSTTRTYTEKWSTYQTYSGGSAPAHKPQMIAGGTIAITGFTTALNLGGIISANTVNISTTTGGATFTNDDYGLTTHKWIRTKTDSVSCCSDVIYLDYSYGAWTAAAHDGASTSTTYGGAIWANSLVGGGPFSLVNKAGLFAAPDVDTTGTTGASAATPDGGASFGGITITLPGSPNGFFVTSKDPNSKYLVETNPLFNNSSGMSSDYLLTRYGLDLDTVQRRLGDGAYEQYLIRQQLISQTGSNVILPGESEAAQMQRLMDNALNIAQVTGLEFGKPLSDTQIASLDQDMVWMVETEVNGQTVLAPVVYLSAATKSMIASGAVIAANNIDLNIESVTNQGGTMIGNENINITTRGDVTNTSGTIKGGNIGITSTEGSIVNQTYADTQDSGPTIGTAVGKGAGIQATGNLSLDANKDIRNLGANMSADGDASLNAGNDIVFDTVEDKNASITNEDNNTTNEASTRQIKSGLSVGGNLNSKSGNDTTFAGTEVNVGGNADVDAGNNLNIISREDSQSKSSSSKSGNVLSGSSRSSSESTTTNVGSNFNLGGDLNARAKNDITIQGSNVDVGGNGDVNAGGNINILDGKNTKTTASQESNTGIGVGGGIYGTESEENTRFQSDSIGSKVNFGGNANLNAGKTLTVQGSELGTGGDMNIEADDVKILEGRNIDETTQKKSTTTFLSVDDGGSDREAVEEDADEEEESNAEARVSAETSAETESSDSGGVNLMDTKTTTTRNYKNTASGSSIKSGGNISIDSNNGIQVRGSDVEAGGNVDLNAKNINIEAAKEIDETTTSTSRTQLGLYGNSDNKAGASADASAEASSGGASADATGSGSGAGAGYNAGDANAAAEANANAGASTDNTVDVMRTKQTTTNTTDITNKASTIKSGGNMNVKADETLRVHGSDIEASGDVNLKAKDMSFTAAEDSSTTTTSTSRTSLGLYAEGEAEANANANASAGVKEGASGGASVDASASAGVGLQGTNTTSSSVEGSTTARTSTIKSGGNMTREAEGKITDEGTQIEAGGDFTQSATEWESKAAKNTTFSSEDSETNTAKFGLYGEAGAEAKAEGEAAIGGASQETGAEAGASAGLKATYNRNTSASTESTSEAVTSNIKSGGNMKTTTTGKTSLEGTNLESGGDMELNAGSLDYKAAKNTSSSSSSSDNIDAELKVGVDATKAVTGSISGGYEAERESETSSEAVMGSMKSGGKLKVNTEGDARFEGTNIESGDDASIKAGGDVKFDAARNESSSSSGSENASASLSASKGKGSSKAGQGFEAEGGFERGTASSSEAVTGSVKSGGKLDVSAGKNATFEGTDLEAAGDMSVDAKGDVNFNAAESTSSEESYGAQVEVKASKGGKDKSGKSEGNEMGVAAEGNYSKSDESTQKAGGLKSGGNIKVKSGGDTNLTGTNIESEGKASLDAGGDVNFKATEDKKESIGIETGIEAGAKNDGQKGSKSQKEGGVSLAVEGEKSSTKTGGSIKAGEIEVNSGGNANFEGTNLDSAGDASVKAKGDVNFNAAESSSIDGSFDASVGSGGSRLKDAGVGGGITRDGTNINTGGNLNIESGGNTTFTGTQAEVEGQANIKAGGTVEKNSAVSGGGQIGLTRGGASVNVDQTNIKAKGGVSESSGQ